MTGGLTSQLSALVPGERLPRAFGLDSLTYNSAGVIGPAAAAVLAAATSPGLATAALATGAAVGAVLIAVLPIPAHHPDVSPPAAGELLAGGRILVRNRVLAAVTGATCLGQVGLGALPVIAVLLAEQHRHPAAAGWLLTSVAAGGLVGSLAWTWRPAAPEHAPTVVMGGLAAAGVPLAVAAVLPSGLQVTAVLFAVSGLSTGPLFGALLMTATTTHRPLHAPRSSPSEPVRRSPPPQPEPPSPAPSPATPPRRSSCLPAPAPSPPACSASCPSPPTAGPAAQRLTRQPT